MAKATKVYKVRKPTPGVKDNGDIVDQNGDSRCIACAAGLEERSGDMECPNLCGIDGDRPLEDAEEHDSQVEGSDEQHEGSFQDCTICVMVVVGAMPECAVSCDGCIHICNRAECWNDTEDELSHKACGSLASPVDLEAGIRLLRGRCQFDAQVKKFDLPLQDDESEEDEGEED